MKDLVDRPVLVVVDTVAASIGTFGYLCPKCWSGLTHRDQIYPRSACFKNELLFWSLLFD